MDEIKVSILCITYNHEKYITRALESFLMQKVNFKYEIIIHDDASTDGTISLIKDYEARYPEKLFSIYEESNQYGKGISYFCDILIPRARGKYIAICEGDDFWIDENKLQKQVDFLDQHNDYVGCVHKFIVVDDDNRELDITTFGDYKKEGCYTLKHFENTELPSQLASFVFKNIFRDKEILYMLHSFAHSARVQGDIKMFMFLLNFGNIYRMNEVMSAYRFVQVIGGNSWSSRLLSNKDYISPYFNLLKLESTFNSMFDTKIKLIARRKILGTNILFGIIRNCDFKNLYIAFRVIIAGDFYISRFTGFLCQKLGVNNIHHDEIGHELY